MGLYDDIVPTEAEKKLIDATAKGERCSFLTGDKEADDPKNGADWGAERTIRAEVIVALATGARDDWEVVAKGIQLTGAKIDGALDFAEETVAYRLGFGRCYFGKVITLINARTRGIYIQNSHIQVSQGPAIDGDNLRCKGALSLRHTSVEGEIRLLGADIGGNLSMSGAALENPDGIAINGDGLTATGGVFLGKGFSAKGEVRLLGAHIGGNLEMNGAALENPDGHAFIGDRLTTTGSVFMGVFMDKKSDTGDAIRFSAKGETRLLGAHIGGILSMDGAELENPDGNAFSGDGLTTKGDVFMGNGFSAKGTVRLPGAQIDGNLSMKGATLGTPKGVAFSGDRLTTKGSVFMDAFRNKEAPDEDAIPFSAKGEVGLLNAQIDGNFSMEGVALENPDGDALNGQGMTVKGGLILRNLKQAPVGRVDLTHATVGQLVDDPESWPAKGSLWIDGFQYGAFAGDLTPTDWERRLEWLDRMPKHGFWPQPYEQLIKVLRQMGHETDARKIGIAKQDAYRDLGKLSSRHKAWLWFLKKTIGYGYEPWLVWRPMALTLVVGWVVFSYGFQMGYMHPSSALVHISRCYASNTVMECRRWEPVKRILTDNRTYLPLEYPRFLSLTYSVDAFFPFVDLHQEKYWEPIRRGPFSWLVEAYLWLHIALGWVLSTVGLLGITGLVKRRSEGG